MRSSPMEMIHQITFNRHILIATDNILNTGMMRWEEWGEGLENNPKSNIVSGCKENPSLIIPTTPHLFSLEHEL